MIEVELRDIPEYEGHYAATKDGRIWSHKQKKFLKACGELDNYQVVMLSKDGEGKMYYVHRLIALAWIPNPNNYPQVNHKDEHKDHNWADNLEWCSVAYNLKYSGVGRKKVPIKCIETGQVFESMYKAAIEMKTHQSNLSEHIRKGVPKSVGGYHWELA